MLTSRPVAQRPRASAGEGRKPGRRVSRKPDLVQAAVRCVARYGINASTTQIAEEAGVPRSAIHYHFKDKRELLGAAFDEVLVGLMASIEDDVAQAESPAEQLEALILGMLPLGRGGRDRALFWYEFILAALRAPDLLAIHRESIARARATVEERIRALQRKGALPQHLDAADVTVLVNACTEGITLALVDGSPQGTDQYRRAVRLLVRELCTSQPAPDEAR